MRAALQALALGSIALAGLSGPAVAQTMDHTILTAQEIKWSPGPASIPKGAEAAVLFGDPSKDGPFAMRLRFPKGYAIPPHTHPRPEIVTVISGTFKLGTGEKADRSKARDLPAGSFFAFAPGMAHFAFVDEDTVVQLNSVGPWGLNYVNPQDDPRKTQ
jgi:quercetin dioxygenase-like cupin family protein